MKIFGKRADLLGKLSGDIAEHEITNIVFVPKNTDLIGKVVVAKDLNTSYEITRIEIEED